MTKTIALKKKDIFRKTKDYFKFFLQSLFWQNKWNLGLILTSLLFNIIIWILLGLLIKPSEFPIPLHYNVYFGIDLTGPSKNIYNLPLVALFIIIINFILAFWFYSKNRIVSYILLFSSLAVQIFVLIGAITVIFINQV